MANKKRIAQLLSFLFIILLSFPGAFQQALAQNPPEISSGFAILIDADSGTVLYEKNAQELAYPASTTKIMTALLVCEMAGDLEEEVTVGAEVREFSAANSRIDEKEGEVLRVIDLLYGTLLPSGNDAAATLAIHFGGSPEGFAALMNARALEIAVGFQPLVYTSVFVVLAIIGVGA